MRRGTKGLVTLGCATALLFPACSDDDGPAATPAPSTPALSPTPSPSPLPTPTAAGTTGCPNEVQALRRPKGRELAGDLDGDGTSERVALAIDRTGPPGCQAFVSVESKAVPGVVAIDEPQMSFDLGLPALDSVTPVGFGPGDEIVIVATSGASTQFFALITVSDGEPVQVTAQDGPYGNLFPYGGSVGHLEASDCGAPTSVDGGVPFVVISSATAVGDNYRLERSFFRAVTPQLEPETTERQTVSFEELVSFPEFGEAPFAHCR
jgi:hypothetical protein